MWLRSWCGLGHRRASGTISRKVSEFQVGPWPWSGCVPEATSCCVSPIVVSLSPSLPSTLSEKLMEKISLDEDEQQKNRICPRVGEKVTDARFMNGRRAACWGAAAEGGPGLALWPSEPPDAGLTTLARTPTVCRGRQWAAGGRRSGGRSGFGSRADYCSGRGAQV